MQHGLVQYVVANLKRAELALAHDKAAPVHRLRALRRIRPQRRRGHARVPCRRQPDRGVRGTGVEHAKDRLSVQLSGHEQMSGALLLYREAGEGRRPVGQRRRAWPSAIKHKPPVRHVEVELIPDQHVDPQHAVQWRRWRRRNKDRDIGRCGAVQRKCWQRRRNCLGRAASAADRDRRAFVSDDAQPFGSNPAQHRGIRTRVQH